ncbi:MAG: hypothetical protein FJ150_00760 [Euryarchaeota archaeon]|nr:hypothetical protein [Euryarchaeota archaeon]
MTSKNNKKIYNRKMRRITLYLGNDQIEYLQKYAEEKDISTSEVIRKAINKFFDLMEFSEVEDKKKKEDILTENWIDHIKDLNLNVEETWEKLKELERRENQLEGHLRTLLLEMKKIYDNVEKLKK